MIGKIKKIRPHMIFGIIYFIIVLIPSSIIKIYLKMIKKELWLICETQNTARDNGYIFYKYMKENHPEIKSYYAIDKKCSDYNKVKKYGNILQWSGIRHYFYYMCATKNISSHKEGNPNQGLFTILHLYLNLYNNRVFLQHGVLYQDFPMFHKKNTKFKIFICGAKGEYDLVKEKYGYRDEVKYTGLARFDNLYKDGKDNNIILFIPTWRRWLNTKDDFINSDYYNRIYSLINNKKLHEILEKENKYLYFYPHISAQKFIDLYKTTSDRVKIFDFNNIDIQNLLIKGSLLITDYSSLFTDFAYMYKPVIYYQYDYNEFYSKHYNKNDMSFCFNFKKNGFGPVTEKEDILINKIEHYIKNDFSIEKKYRNRIDDFFILHDKNNCQRIFDEIIRCDKK